MHRWIKPGLICLAILLLLIIARAPAPLLLGYLNAHIQPVQLVNPSGTLWLGESERVYHPTFELLNTQWNYRNLVSLWRGPGYHLSAQTHNQGNLSLNAHLGWFALFKGINATLKARAVEALIPISDLPLPAVAKAIPLNGDVIVKLNQLTIKQQWPFAAEGQLVLANLVYQEQQTWSLGQIIADISSTDSGIQANLSSNSDWLTLNGVANIEHDGRYAVNLELSISEALPVVLRTLLASAGRRQADGRIGIQYNGRLPSPLNTNNE